MSFVSYILERLDDEQWTPVLFNEIKNGDIFRMFTHTGVLKRFSNGRWLLVATGDASYISEINDYSIKFKVFGE